MPQAPRHVPIVLPEGHHWRLTILSPDVTIPCVAIDSFKCPDTQRLFAGTRIRRFVNIEAVAMRKLAILNRAAKLDDLRVPPGNRLEALKRDRLGQHSIRINDQFRVCFVWTTSGAVAVEIVDYH